MAICNKVLSVLTFGAVSLRTVHGDLPVHCLRSGVLGDWEFSLSALTAQRTSCGHERPDTAIQQPAPDSVVVQSKKKVTLSDPNLATADDGSTGSWTMVYDEGFELALGDNTYFAFSKFDPLGSKSNSQCGETQVGWYHDTGRTRWGCFFGKRVGTTKGEPTNSNLRENASPLSNDIDMFTDKPARNTKALAENYFESIDSSVEGHSNALQKGPGSGERSVSRDHNFLSATDEGNAKATFADSFPVGDVTSAERKEPSTVYDSASVRQEKVVSRQRAGVRDAKLAVSNSKENHITSVAESSYDSPLSRDANLFTAKELNVLQTSWTAYPYERYIGKTMREMNRMAGLRRSLPVSAQAIEMRKRRATLVQKHVAQRRGPFRNLFDSSSDAAAAASVRNASVSDDDLPDVPATGGNAGGGNAGETGSAHEWDWRADKGRNFIALDGINQGHCGSCYAIATMRMLSARHKIKQGKSDLESFSVEFPLNCAEYTQGCSGGYAFLTSKWSQDVGVLPAKCAPYTGGGSCNVQCDLQDGPSYRADNHRYVGGYYGGADESSMLTEVVQSGPLVTAFEPSMGFMYYKGGIYKAHSVQQAEWEKVDHAALVVGYGEESGQKYWILQNSWGDDWGEGGFFRMVRGENDSGVESIVVAADVVQDENPEVLRSFLQSA